MRPRTRGGAHWRPHRCRCLFLEPSEETLGAHKVCGEHKSVNKRGGLGRAQGSLGWEERVKGGEEVVMIL